MQTIPPPLLVCKHFIDKSFIEAATPGYFGTVKAVFKERNREPRILYEVFDQQQGTKERSDSALLYDFFRYLNARKLQIVNVIGEK